LTAFPASTALVLFVYQVKEERSLSGVNLDTVKCTTPGLPGRAYSFILIGRNVDQWRYCLELPEHDTSVQSTFRSQFWTEYFHSDCILMIHSSCHFFLTLTDYVYFIRIDISDLLFYYYI